MLIQVLGLAVVGLAINQVPAPIDVCHVQATFAPSTSYAMPSRVDFHRSPQHAAASGRSDLYALRRLDMLSADEVHVSRWIGEELHVEVLRIRRANEMTIADYSFISFSRARDCLI